MPITVLTQSPLHQTGYAGYQLPTLLPTHCLDHCVKGSQNSTATVLAPGVTVTEHVIYVSSDTVHSTTATQGHETQEGLGAAAYSASWYAHLSHFYRFDFSAFLVLNPTLAMGR
jgi:hypothetical protein